MQLSDVEYMLLMLNSDIEVCISDMSAVRVVLACST